MSLHVGQASLRGDLRRYAKHFNMVELGAEPGRLPKASRLRSLREEVSEDFVFSLRVPQALSMPDAQDAAAASLSLRKSAEALNARWLVLRTPSTVTPTRRSFRFLESLCSTLEGPWHLAWEPKGIWEADEALVWSKKLGLYLVRDVSRDEPPPGLRVYTRLLALGSAARVGLAAAERVAESLADREESYVVLEGEGAVSAARLLRGTFAELEDGALEEHEDLEEDVAGEDEDEAFEDDDDPDEESASS